MSFGEERRTARTEHVCHLCEGPIPKRSEYERWCSSLDGQVLETKAHTYCLAIARKLKWCFADYGYFDRGGLIEHLKEYAE